MTKIFPDIEVEITCPDCEKNFQPDSFHLTGTHVLGSGKCPQCRQELFLEMPTGSGLHYPVIINSDGVRKDKMPFSNWFTVALQRARKSIVDTPVHISKLRSTAGGKDKLLILNTIDQSYGHCLYTLLNAAYYQKKQEYYLLVIVQQEFRWLLPEGVDEVWVVDMPFAKAHLWYTSLSDQVRQRISEFPEAFLARAFPQAPEGEFNIEHFSKVKPFPLDEWNKRMDKATITFIWRTDRFWKRALPKIVDNRFTNRFLPKYIKRLRNRRQFSWITRFSKELKLRAPFVDFAVAGMDSREFKLPSWVKDYRYPTHEDATAREMCERYATSHLVIGCNGSSLVLPSFHAGSVVNIVPHDGWAVSAGSFYLRPTSPADMQYRYLLLSPETSISRMVKIVVQMLRDRPLVQILSGDLNNHDNGAHYSAWANFRREGFNNIKYFDVKDGMLTNKI